MAQVQPSSSSADLSLTIGVPRKQTRQLTQAYVSAASSLGRSLLSIRKLPLRSIAERLQSPFVDDLFGSTPFLSSLQSSYPSFHPLMIAVLRNRLSFFSPAVKTPLHSLTPSEGDKIGGALALSLLTSTEPSAAVDAWFGTYPALLELDDANPLFKPMIVVVASGLFKDASWGVTARVWSGAFLSIFDVMSDIFSIYSLHKKGNHQDANIMTALIALSFVATLQIVLIQNRRRSSRVITVEVLYVFAFVKPAIDAHRVGEGYEKHALDSMSPYNEFSITKIVEMSFESIPGAFVQSSAMMRIGGFSPALTVSIASSILSTAFTVASINYDDDSNVLNRRQSPSIFGFLKDTNAARTASLLFMAGMAACMFAVKCAAIAMLSVAMPAFLQAYIAASFLLYFLVKAGRRDLRGAVPFDGLAAWIAIIFLHIVSKVLADYLLGVGSRKAFFMGGLLWSWTFFEGLVFLFVSAHIYTSLYEHDGKIPSQTVWVFFASVSALAVLFFALFLGSIEGGWRGEYARSFVSTQTASQYICGVFRTSDVDEEKMEIFCYHPSDYVELDGEVRQWVRDNWAKWDKEMPDWFTAALVQKIPDNMLPVPALDKLKRKGRRKSSILSLLGGVEERDGGIAGGGK